MGRGNIGRKGFWETKIETHIYKERGGSSNIMVFGFRLG